MSEQQAEQAAVSETPSTMEDVMTPIPNKPLPLPASAPSAEARRTVNERLRGHSKSPAWLPEGLWPELDSIRAEHLRVLGQVASGLDALDALTARFREEDAQHQRVLRQAQRDGTPDSAEDRRTPRDERQVKREAADERLWAAIYVLADVADSVIALVREHEDRWLADLRSQLAPAQEKRREAARLHEEAKAEEWQLHRLGQWLQVTADNGAHGAQPAPTPEVPPKQFSADVFESMLERPWHKRREAEELPRAWSEHSEDVAEVPVDDEPGSAPEEPSEGGDPTGQVLPLDETVNGAAA